jgi:hypothetical protein
MSTGYSIGFVILLLLGCIIRGRLIERLRRCHVEIWKELGEPEEFAAQFWKMSGWKADKYILTAKWRGSTDFLVILLGAGSLLFWILAAVCISWIIYEGY